MAEVANAYTLAVAAIVVAAIVVAAIFEAAIVFAPAYTVALNRHVPKTYSVARLMNRRQYSLLGCYSCHYQYFANLETQKHRIKFIFEILRTILRLGQ